MKTLNKIILLASFVLFNFSIFSQEVKAEINISFSIDTRFGMAKGKFNKSMITITDLNKGTAVVDIDIKSIDTNLGMRDNHLRNEDFFDIKTYPAGMFRLTSLIVGNDGKLTGTGSLTLKGVTREYSFPVTLTKTESKDEYFGKIKLNRNDFKIDYNSAVNPIKNEVEVEFRVIINK